MKPHEIVYSGSSLRQVSPIINFPFLKMNAYKFDYEVIQTKKKKKEKTQ